MSAVRTIIEKRDKQGLLRWFCEDCGSQVQGASPLANRCQCGHPKREHVADYPPGKCLLVLCSCKRFKAPTAHVLYGPCSCDGWTNTDNPELALEVANLMHEGLEVNP